MKPTTRNDINVALHRLDKSCGMSSKWGGFFGTNRKKILAMERIERRIRKKGREKGQQKERKRKKTVGITYMILRKKEKRLI